MKVSRAFLAVLAAASFGCGSETTSPTGVAVIRATTSFGQCLGYCRTTLEITSTEAVLVRQAPRGELPDARQALPVDAKEWQALQDAVDRKRLEALPAVVGCPDCADGGAESLEVVAGDWQKSVSFDFGANLGELQPLLDRVRAVRSRFGS